ncbi:hypothetical protein H6P81_015643 [Aristolochia fimbriata]|uniref:Uncharacterized protein n=1 Tax=Aristolochia fimbriata TaxID=158543 RepID=A0AAV7EAQ4_ARIFI|nr:hypothetical protein H6P81_015643 [Aristolochia fimbriata]
MAALSSPCVASSFSYAEGKESKELRRSAEYHPTVWGNQFITISIDQEKLDEWSKRVTDLKEEVMKMLENAKGSEKLEMELIDNLQRLGVAYHFEKEIEEALKLMYNNSGLSPESTDWDLHSTALQFRLLRRRGYRVSSDVFSKFLDQQGKFKEALTTDPNGMLSLYEAAFLGTHREAILDEALAFTKKHLQLAVNAHGHLKHPLEAMVKHALELPLYRRIYRLDSRNYITFYEMQEGHSEKLLELAKYDYNRLQSLNKKELGEVSRWWKELKLAEKLSFARDRAVECYFWPVAVYHEPKYSRGRVHATKVIALTTVIDDIYDVYGTLNELELFTHAIQSWDLAAMDQLPDYMKDCYIALLDCIKAMEEDLAPQGKSHHVLYLIESMKRLCRAYLVEARWFNQRYIPGVDEYIQCSLVSCTYPMITTLCCVGMGDEVQEELFTWLESDPTIVDGTSRVCRFMDDIVSSEFEQKRGHVASAVQCYVKEQGLSEEEACKKLREMTDIAWKDINEACLEPAPFPVPLLQRIVGLARVMEDLYQYGDGLSFSNTYTKEKVAVMLVNEIPI